MSRQGRGRGWWGLLASAGISALVLVLLYLQAGVQLERLAEEWSRASALTIGLALAVGIFWALFSH